MKTIIYSFTGTGNSLAVAKKVAAALPETELVPIPSAMATPGEIIPSADRVGIICPVYFSGLPDMVALFAGRLVLSMVPYTFAILTQGGGGGGAALAQLNGILQKKAGPGLSAGYAVTMPGNYILLYASATGEKLTSILASADREIMRITEEIAGCREHPLPRSFITSIIHALFYHRFVRSVHEKDRTFTVSDACTSCGICANICPAHNIDLVDGKPVWNHRCELCCGCIHLCPVQAIQAGKKTAGRPRYRNPEIPVPELFIWKE